MEKHKYNIFPEMSDEEFENLLNDLQAKGFDCSQPIVIFDGKILDGWNRYRACQKLDIAFVERIFLGTQAEAIDFVMRTNKRRNLNKGQWATIAAEATEIVEAIKEATEKERRERQAITQGEMKGLSGKYFPDSPTLNTEEVAELTYEYDEPKKDDYSTRSAVKIGKVFDVNPTYLKQAVKLKESSPEKFKDVKEGKIKLPQAVREAYSERQQTIIEKRQAIKNHAGQKWRENVYKIGITLSSIVANGGIERLTEKWSDADKEAMSNELTELAEKLLSYAKQFMQVKEKMANVG